VYRSARFFSRLGDGFGLPEAPARFASVLLRKANSKPESFAHGCFCSEDQDPRFINSLQSQKGEMTSFLKILGFSGVDNMSETPTSPFRPSFRFPRPWQHVGEPERPNCKTIKSVKIGKKNKNQSMGELSINNSMYLGIKRLKMWKLFGGVHIVLYTHYPFISTDLLHDFRTSQKSVNKTETMAKSKFKTPIKILYYKLLCFFYGRTAKFVDRCFVNSSWTKGHISEIYGREPTRLCPPCDCTRLAEPSSVARNDHDLQLQVMEFMKRERPDVRLSIVGGPRDADDGALIRRLEGAALDSASGDSHNAE
jgi:hypothetical protein